MIEAGASITRKPHQRIAERFNLKPNHHGLAIVVPFRPLLYLTDVLTKKLIFDIYEPRNKRSLKSYMQAVDLELKHHPIIVVVYGRGVSGNLLRTDIGDIDIKEDIMAPLFPAIATHLADNPKIFLFVFRSGSSKRHALNFVEAIWENCIVGYIACDNLRRAGDIVEDELAHPSMFVQEIFTSISDKLPPHATMTVIDRLKEPVYLYPHGSELMETHSRSQGIVSIMCSHTSHHASLPTLESTEESGFLSRVRQLSIAAKEPDTESHLLEQPIKKLKTELSPKQSKGVPKQAESSDEL